MKWTPHPILNAPSDEEIILLARNDPELLERLHRSYEDRIQSAIDNPIEDGFRLPGLNRIVEMLNDDYDELIALGGNRSGKTHDGGIVTVDAGLNSRDGHIVCFSQNADTSVKVQQAAIWSALPKEYRRKTKTMEAYINHSMQNGFTGSGLILPDTRTRIDFKTYTQFSNNPTLLEGFEFGFKNPDGINLGAWLDEYLGDARLVNTLRFRLATRNSKLMITFTPIRGYTPFVADYLKGAETLESKPARLLEGRAVPVRQRAGSRDAAIVYLHADENPFGNPEAVEKKCAGVEDEILVRYYGIPIKSITSLLPLFSTRVNVLSHRKPNRHGMLFPSWEQLRDRKRWTWYQVVDPAAARSYAAIWAAVNSHGDIYIAREWPDRNNYGEWSIFGDPHWKRGPASEKPGYSVEAYSEKFREIEASMGIDVFERIGDSRYFAREEDSDSEDLFTHFADQGMHFVASDGRKEHIGATALDDWFSYNPNEKVDLANRPRCYIHEGCGNLIDAAINYNALGKTDEALKDFFDLLRYLRMHNRGEGPDHVTERDMIVTRRGRGGY